MKRRLTIPALLLLSLSLGSWLGTSWHAASLAKPGSACCATCLDGGRLLAAIQHPSNVQFITHGAVGGNEKSCPFCLAGVLVQDAPQILSAATTAIELPAEHLISPLLVVVSAAPLLLPPGRAPPSA